jgi:hypothetical protein
MKHFLFLLLITITTIGFSQTKSTLYVDKIKEFDSIAKPSPTNDLSKYFRRNIDDNLLDNYKINEFDENQNHIYLAFKLSKEDQAVPIRVTSPYSELNKSIADAFLNFDISKLNIRDKSPLNIYMLQILSRDGDKMIFNCSTNIIYDRYPVYDGCESNTSYSEMQSCIKNLLETYVANNISPEQLEKAKVLGLLTLKPRFIIDEKGRVEQVIVKNPKDSLSVELKRILTQFPIAKTPALRNGKPTKLPFNETIKLIINSENKEYIADVIKSKDSTLNPNNELALHFKKFISKEELQKIFFTPFLKRISIGFSLDKKGKLINVKANSLNPILNNRLIEIFRTFPIEKLNIKSTNVLESYSYTIISEAYPVNVIQCNDKPNVYIPAYYDKYCEKSDSPKELMNCFNERISTYIASSFDTSVRSKTNLTGDVRIYCSFQVDVNSKIINIKVKAPNPGLANEMEDMLRDMPRVYKPAYLNGVAIKSSYTIPVTFQLGNNIPEDSFEGMNKSIQKTH